MVEYIARYIHLDFYLVAEAPHLVQVCEGKICNTPACLLDEEVLRNLQDILPNLATCLPNDSC